MAPMHDYLLVIGNSDGIGRALTHALLARGDTVVGISRSPLELAHAAYTHHTLDVTRPEYRERLVRIQEALGPPRACIFCVGIGNDEAGGPLAGEANLFATNLLAMVVTLEVLVPPFLERGAGHFIGLSSLLDDAFVPDSPGYCAAKAGMGAYLKALGLRWRKRGVHFTNLRFGFIDTKMAKAPVRPMLRSPERAARVVLDCLEKRPIQRSWPRSMGVVVRLIRWWLTLRVWIGR